MKQQAAYEDYAVHALQHLFYNWGGLSVSEGSQRKQTYVCILQIKKPLISTSLECCSLAAIDLASLYVPEQKAAEATTLSTTNKDPVLSFMVIQV